MIEIKDIKDGDSLKEWLTEWPKANGLDEDAARAVAVTIAHRTAMRVLPIWWQWSLTKAARERDLTALPILRCSLTSRVAGKMPTPEIDDAADSAFYIAFNTGAIHASATASSFPASASTAASATAYAASAASSLNDPGTSEYTASAANVVTYTANAGLLASVTWALVREDCALVTDGPDALSTSLWLHRENPYVDVWNEIATTVPGPEWAFWIKWYQDALDSRPQNWPMLEQIALIDPEVWDEGAGAVAERIGEIEREFADATELSETNLTPEQALAKNSKVVLLQLDTLKIFVEEEIQNLRGVSNDISDEAMSRIVLLERILASVAAIQAALSEGSSSGKNALAIVEEMLPKVFEAADELADNAGSTEISETIVMMGATIEHLTKRGAPGYMATGIAAVEVVMSPIRKWLKRRKASKGQDG